MWSSDAVNIFFHHCRYFTIVDISHPRRGFDVSHGRRATISDSEWQTSEQQHASSACLAVGCIPTRLRGRDANMAERTTCEICSRMQTASPRSLTESPLRRLFEVAKLRPRAKFCPWHHHLLIYTRRSYTDFPEIVSQDNNSNRRDASLFFATFPKSDVYYSHNK